VATGAALADDDEGDGAADDDTADVVFAGAVVSPDPAVGASGGAEVDAGAVEAALDTFDVVKPVVVLLEFEGIKGEFNTKL